MTETTVVVTTEAGQVRGARSGGVHAFLGVPYAAAPVGYLRIKPPQPHPAWTGERDATREGANAPQPTRAAAMPVDLVPLVGDGWQRGDDFLTANVWTPDPEATGLPVMVFIHGGAFIGGCSDAAVNDGSGFARSGVVCVAINYRLGVEGFLPIQGAPTNLGLRDQIAALAWVQRNIAAFGGDPGNITVFGESAGAMSIASLVASPLAQGLFKRAIIESGHGSMVRPVAIAERVTRAIAKLLKVAPTAQGFASRSVEECLAAQDRVSNPRFRLDLRDDAGREPTYGLSRFLPVYGDDVLPERPLEALAKGVGRDVDVLIGTNREEMNLYFVPTGVRKTLPGFLAGMMLKRVEPRAKAALKAYGLGRPGTRPGDALTEAMHDLVFRLPARWFADAHQGRTHFYEFDWRSPAFGGALGACHALELPFVFDTLASCAGEGQIAGVDPPQELATRVHGLWAGFARDGGLPWPEYKAGQRIVYSMAKDAAGPDAVMPVEALLT
ncbi:MAG TPA: carboxylesterase family protein [Phenylobacterium sp.]